MVKITEKEYLKQFRERNPTLSDYSDSDIIAKAKEKRPDLEFEWEKWVLEKVWSWLQTVSNFFNEAWTKVLEWIDNAATDLWNLNNKIIDSALWWVQRVEIKPARHMLGLKDESDYKWGLLANIWKTIKDSWELVWQSFESIVENPSLSNIEKETYNIWGNIMWGVVNTLSQPIISWLDTIVPDETQQDILNYLQEESKTDSFVWNIVNWLQKISEYEERIKIEDPEKYREFKAATGFIDWLLLKWWKELVTKVWKLSKNVWKKWVETIKNQVDKITKYIDDIDVKGKVDNVVEKTKTAKDKIDDILHPKKDLDGTIKEVFDSTDDELLKIKNSVNDLEIDWIKTYKELWEKIDDEIWNLARQQDDLLEKAWWNFKLDDLETSSTSGNIKTNYVKQALNDMENLAKATNDIDAMEKVFELKNKTSFSLKDLNDLAREYWVNFKNKVYNNAWNQKIWDIAVSYENTRSWLKNLVREKFWSDELKNFDTKMNWLYKTRESVSKIEDKVQKLRNKVQERWLFEKIWNKIWDLVDFASWWMVKGFFSRLIPRNAWLKTLNHLDLEERLEWNLKRISQFLKNESKMSNSEFEKWIDDLIEKVSSKKVKMWKDGEKVVEKEISSSKKVQRTKNEAIMQIRNYRTELEKLAKNNWIDIKMKIWPNEYTNTLNYTIKINKLLKKKRDLRPWEKFERSDFERKVYEYKQKVIKNVIEDIQNWYIKWKLNIKKHWNEASIIWNIWKIKLKTHLPLYSEGIPKKVKFWKSIKIENKKIENN